MSGSKKNRAGYTGALLTLSAGLLLLPMTATSAILSSHYAVDTYARAANLLATEVTLEGDDTVQTGDVTSNSGRYSGLARAESGPGGLKAFAESSSLGSTFSSSVGQAMWRDILFLSGPVLPDDVLFNFSVSATLFAQQGIGYPDVSRAGISVSPTQSTSRYPLMDFFTTSGGRLGVLIEALGSDPIEANVTDFVTQPWTTSSLTANGDGSWDFNGTFSFEAEVFSAGLLRTPDAGAPIALSLSVGGSARSSDAWADSFSTVTLTSVTNVDGTALSPDITTYYDSPLGAPVAAVPVPAGAWLMASGLLMLASRARRHQ